MEHPLSKSGPIFRILNVKFEVLGGGEFEDYGLLGYDECFEEICYLHLQGR
jgi:hypothetical protein